MRTEYAGGVLSWNIGRSVSAMRRTALVGSALCITGLLFGSAGASARAATAETLCVGGHPGCYATIQAAVDAAADGDTIVVGVGTFQGGITITKSVSLVGVSAAATVIRSGGPVITIGTFEGTNGTLRVALSHLTITGGVNDSPGFAQGGGVWIPQSAGEATGAAVTIDRSVISDNQAAPKATFSDANPGPCGVPQDECAFASGGGIANAGTLTLTRTLVADNIAGSPAISHRAQGGGISNGPQGTLTVTASTLSGNQAAVSPPDGRFSEGGGIENFGAMTIENSQISGNTSAVASAVPSSILANDLEQNADAGGIDLSSSGSATIHHSNISANSVSDFDSTGDAQAFNGGIDDDGTLLVTDSNVDHNTVAAQVPDGSGLVAAASAGGLGLTTIASLRSVHIGSNTLSAISKGGIAFVGGAGIEDVSGQLTLDHTQVTGNSGNGTAGIFSLVVGGGILETSLGGPDPQLTITASVVTANALTTTAGTPQGGGIFNGGILGGGPYPITLTRTVIQGNDPDQCIGGC